MRILVVEDEPTLCEQLRKTLVEQGYTVDTATNGEDGFHLGQEESFDAAILDLGLPKRDGLTVLKHWRSNGNRMPVIVLTARDSWSDKVSGIDAGADDISENHSTSKSCWPDCGASFAVRLEMQLPYFTGDLSRSTRFQAASLWMATPLC
jgi:CheY-like chemotaxis protein